MTFYAEKELGNKKEAVKPLVPVHELSYRLCYWQYSVLL